MLHRTGLHLACRYGHTGVADRLLEHHAKIDQLLPPLGDWYDCNHRLYTSLPM